MEQIAEARRTSTRAAEMHRAFTCATATHARQFIEACRRQPRLRVGPVQAHGSDQRRGLSPRISQPRTNPGGAALIQITSPADPMPHLQAKLTVLLNGMSRSRWPVSAKMALASAGAAGGVPGSPMPRMRGMFSKTCTAIGGTCGIRSGA